jgi:L-amino acid N-acyltransferase
MIRPAAPTDAPAIAAIWNAYIRDTTVTFSPDEKTDTDVAVLINGPDPCLVWHDGAGVTGFARYFQFRGGRGYAHAAEHTILLAPAAQGKGAGKALMNAVFDHARGRGFHTLMAGVSGENAAGIAFHAACGFATVGVVPESGFKFGRWIDLVLMQKRL